MSSARITIYRRLSWRHVYGCLPFAILAVVWFGAVPAFHVKPVFLPRLEALPGAMWDMFVKEHIIRDIGISCFRVIAGFLIAVILATPIGILMGYSKRVSRILGAFMGFVRYMPVPVFIPLCILWFGSGDLQKMIIIFLGAFFQLVLMVEDAGKAVKAEFYEAATMLQAPRRDLVTRVLLPAAMPQIFDSYRICIGWAWTYLIVAEIVGATSGLGYYIMKAQRYLLIPQVFAAMLLIGLLGMLTDMLMSVLGAVLFPWVDRKRGIA